MELDKYKEKLLDLKDELETNSVNEVVSFKDSIGELSLIDNHPADVGDELFERSKDLSIRENNQMLLEKVKNALDKIARGTFGICDSCLKQIESERLEAIPYASECIKCNKEKERSFRRRPIEEEVLGIPFSRTYNGDQQTAYDGEDSWQDVARYGTSDSGQDVLEESKDLPYEHSDESRGFVEEVEEIYQQDLEGHKFTNRKFKK
ncbi:TraR/DksA C4-type zinc finger protein [Anaerobranca gottschalkii]|uniref:Transcriptional regulator, TraR/DksA family n=1 Tax=Anaerobranca gottschalkii DSM 13577 TaxID=1120990 RepID=A0A1H9YWQ5_9FIRM|nr:TraR/DksA C4-type zinc finger protein [Anaerobranca gottschalkii]SES73577.1 transcriptional regulator, TraR/DksA family [Anaerobranca gottschalkii DSM 13577]